VGILVMSKKEREQLKVFERLNSGEITRTTASQMLKLSVGWFRKKLKRYREQGDKGLVHLNRGKLAQENGMIRRRHWLLSFSNQSRKDLDQPLQPRSSLS